MNKIYLDNAASTRVREEVIENMQNSLSDFYGNPSSTHSFGRSAKTLIEKARKNIASCLNALPSEIIFTSGGTEANNMILRSAVRDLGVQTIITSKIEHHAVLHTIGQLQKEYHISVQYVSLQDNGMPDLTNLKLKLKNDDTRKLVSLMHVNNEIGNITDLDAIAELCKKHNTLFHSDTVQSIGHYGWDVKKTKVDFLSASAHKFHGPKGIGFVYLNKNIALQPLIFGGEQERGFRAGTESLHNIIGLETAIILSYKNLDDEKSYIRELKRYFIEQLKLHLPGTKFNGCSSDMDNSAYTIVNVCLPISEDKGELLLFQLDIKGIACSRGSACQSGSTVSSHVLIELLSEADIKKPSIRFSFSKYNTKEELDSVVKVLKSFV